MTMRREGRLLHCDNSCGCGHPAILAQEFADHWEIRTKKHGQDHILTIPKWADSSVYRGELVDQLAGSTN